jgi:ubiquinone/menaquinone biosynthesis C-methylase UbiE
MPADQRRPVLLGLPKTRGSRGSCMAHPLLSVAKRIWPMLPDKIRDSGPAQRFEARLREKHQVGPLATLRAMKREAKPAPSTSRRVTTLEEIDAMLREVDDAEAISDDTRRLAFASFHMDFPWPLPEDPDSPAYREVQLKLYEWLHGKPYSVSNEVSAFDVQAAAKSPFPYYTQSAQTIGGQLIGIGHIIRSLDLPPGSSVLEFGPGWGNTTLFLARSGYRVTAVDIEQNFIDLINERARRKQVSVETILGDFSLLHGFDRRFDAILFFECFHHCADPHALVAGLDRVVAPGGKIVFASEPITDYFPIPWGLRLDGESLWAIRKNGWLELGFKETYFRELMARNGWVIEKKTCGDSLWNTLFVATRASEATAGSEWTSS